MATNNQYNMDLATRQAQINEWEYNNKMDTLFVFQLLFISLVFVAILMILKVQGVIPGVFVWYTMGVLLILIVATIINRSVYTTMKRDTRFWNRKQFAGDNGTTSPLGPGDASYLSYIDAVRANGEGVSGGDSGVSGSGSEGGACRCPN